MTWNPVTGCRNTCEYCDARKMARRFCGDTRLNLSDDRILKEHIHQVNEQTGADLARWNEWDNFEIRYAVNWIIVGAETSNRRGKVTPKREWIEKIVTTPIFMKESDELKAVWGENLIQEFPLWLGGEVFGKQREKRERRNNSTCYQNWGKSGDRIYC